MAGMVQELTPVVKGKYYEIFDAAEAAMNAPVSVTNAGMKSAVDAFNENIRRLASLGMFPAQLFDLSQLTTRASELAAYQLTGHLPLTDEDQIDWAKFRERCNANMGMMMKAREEGGLEYTHAIRTMARLEGSQAAKAASHNLTSLSVLWDTPVWNAGFVTFYFSVLLGTWTAYEALAHDLWVSAVNARPAALGGKAQIAKKGRQRRKAARPIRADDVGSQYEQKFSFNSLYGLAQAYEALFGDLMSSIFFLPELVGLELMRNVIIHRASLLDDWFWDEKVRRRAKIPPNQRRNDRLRVDARDVANYMKATIQAGRSLVEYVDNWLTKNP
jgi:hypothetical protein